jgi:perosamine synthetase
LPIIDKAPQDAARIPLAAPNITDGDRAAMCEAMLDRSSIAYGPSVAAFERAVAELVESPHAVATQSGTAALHLALIVSGVEGDDEVLVPTLTYVAPANAVRYVGAHPVFLDVEARYRQLDVAGARAFVQRQYAVTDGVLRNRRTGRRLRAILTVDLLGHPCDINGVLDLAAEFELAVIDDAAEAFGATVRGRPLGSWAPVSVLSFNANKLITTGGGGMLLCHDADLAKRARLLASHGKARGSAVYHHEMVGFNYAMAAPQAALGLSQLKRFEEFLDRKREIAARYASAFAQEPAVTLPAQSEEALASYWLYTVHVPAAQRKALMATLAQDGIETRPIFNPMHRVRAHCACQADACPVAEELSETGLSLPCSTDLSDAELDEVVEAVIAGLAQPVSAVS